MTRTTRQVRTRGVRAPTSETCTLYRKGDVYVNMCDYGGCVCVCVCFCLCLSPPVYWYGYGRRNYRGQQRIVHKIEYLPELSSVQAPNHRSTCTHAVINDD